MFKLRPDLGTFKHLVSSHLDLKFFIFVFIEIATALALDRNPLLYPSGFDSPAFEMGLP